jgi:hypothetical protein
MKRSARVPVSTVIGISHDPLARAHVSARLRRRNSTTGLMRLGVYHSLDGWSFWATGLARNAVVVEASGARYRYLVIEVEDPARTVTELSRACRTAPITPLERAAPPLGGIPNSDKDR